jgi:O-antigen biosynthesis protein
MAFVPPFDLNGRLNVAIWRLPPGNLRAGNLLVRLPSFRTRGVHRVRGFRWQATDNDPGFVFFLRFLPFAYALFEIRNADRPIDPQVFIDWGKGFEANDMVECTTTRNGIYVVALRAMGPIWHLRIDPSTYVSQFEFRAFGAFDLASVKAFVDRRLGDAKAAGAAMPKCQIIAEGNPGPVSQLGTAARRFLNVTDHLNDIVRLAARRYAARSPSASSPSASSPSASNPTAPDAPLISFIAPVYNTPAAYLERLLNSFQIQQEGTWELILVDDASTSQETIAWLEEPRNCACLMIIRRAKNTGIAVATNAGLGKATGKWVGFVDHDDALAPFAVARLTETVRDHPTAKFIYTDEVVADKDLVPEDYYFKPAYDPVLLSGVNYINHLSLYRRDRLLAIGGLREGFDGSQDYDLLLRYLKGVDPTEVLHLPYPAYLWRRDGHSYSVAFLERATTNARRALGEAYAVDDVPLQVEPALVPNLHRVGFEGGVRPWPKISIVIPNRDSFELMSTVLEGIVHHTDYPDFEIIIPDNGSKDPRLLALYEEMRHCKFTFRAEIVEEPFNFARQVNRGMKLARGDHILLLNNDIGVQAPGWLKEMVSCLAYPNAGIVGARLLYPDGSIQHAGVIVGLGGVAGHWFCGELASEQRGAMARLAVRQTFSAVTGACMLISGACRAATGDFDEETFAIAYNDIDYCLRAGRLGFRTVWTPFATLTHQESASRGDDEAPANADRFRREQEALRTKYGLDDYVDRAFNPWYGRHSSKPGPASLEELPEPR